MLPTCYTQYMRPSEEECPFEVHLDEGKVERSGYVSTEVMVKRLIEAGERLVSFREAEFPDGQEVPDDYEALGELNVLDALQRQKQVSQRIAESARRAKVVVKEEIEKDGGEVLQAEDGK